MLYWEEKNSGSLHGEIPRSRRGLRLLMVTLVEP